MCFYDQHRFACGHWKWGHFRQHCAKEYTYGYTCGMKLVMQTVPVKTKCKLCNKIDTKMRRRAAEVDRIGRWQREGSKFRESIEKALEIIKVLDSEIYDLGCESQRRLTGIGQERVMNAPGKETGTDFKERQTNEVRPGVSLHDDAQIKFKLIDKVAGPCGLPITFETAIGPATVMAVPDSGADINVISYDLAVHLGYHVPSGGEREDLGLLDGGIVFSEGVIRAVCRFSLTFPTETETYHCVFRVLRNLTSPLIMSCSFLKQTETFTRFRHRLVTLPSNIFRLPRIRALGQTRSRLHCSINGRNVEALADSGSDIDVVSLDYAVLQGWKLQDSKLEVVLADGRKIPSFGTCEAQLSIGKDAKMVAVGSIGSTIGVQRTFRASQISRPRIQESAIPSPFESSQPVRHVVQTTFFVLDGISEDALIGSSSIASLKVFEQHSEAFTTEACDERMVRALNRISLTKKGKSIATTPLNGTTAAASAMERDRELHQQLNAADQHENARRERADEIMRTMSDGSRTIFENEENERRSGYDDYRAQLVRALSSFN